MSDFPHSRQLLSLLTILCTIWELISGVHFLDSEHSALQYLDMQLAFCLPHCLITLMQISRCGTTVIIVQWFIYVAFNFYVRNWIILLNNYICFFAHLKHKICTHPELCKVFDLFHVRTSSVLFLGFPLIRVFCAESTVHSLLPPFGITILFFLYRAQNGTDKFVLIWEAWCSLELMKWTW